MTFPRRLSQFGYEAACAGKLHHVGPDQMQGWTQRLGGGDLHVDRNHIDIQDEQEERHIRKKIGRLKWSDAKEIQRAGVGLGRCESIDNLTLDAALLFIEHYFADPMYDRPQSPRPLLMKVSLTQPHYPFLTDAERFSYYLNRVKPFPDEHLPPTPTMAERRVVAGEEVEWREIRRALAAYYGMIDRLDEMFGIVLGRLEHLGQNLDDWIIIYTSDHGDMMGEHGIWEKGSMYDGSARVPLIIRWPTRFDGGRVVRENVNLCDLFATLCDLTGVPAPEGLDSRSMVPLLCGDSGDWNNETVVHEKEQSMLKQGDLKLIWCGKERAEVLFDLAADPGETTNLIDDPAYADALTRLRGRMAELGMGPDADADYVNAGY
jgi:choline-sulfatase